MPMTTTAPDDHPLGRRTEDDEAIDELVVVLRARIGHDFSKYKGAAMRQRLARRMNALRMHRLSEYVRFIEAVPSEVDHLLRDLLINVTAFFRDPQAFDALRTHALNPLLEAVSRDRALRIWVPGCATGEEAYSIAILLHEAMQERLQAREVRIFGTDVNPDAVETARLGVYSRLTLEGMSPARRRSFFSEEDDCFRVNREIREMVVFACQNVLQDPPFSRIDLLSCRNLLIYLDARRQQTTLSSFHYALNPGGYLFLGSSESLGDAERLFGPLDRRWRIYRRNEVTRDEPSPPVRLAEAQRSKQPVVARLLDRILLPALVPPTVIVDDRGGIVFVHGNLHPFLEATDCNASRTDIREAVRPELRPEIECALKEAMEVEGEVLRRDMEVRSTGLSILFDLRVRQVLEPPVLRGLTLLSFETVRPKSAGHTTDRPTPPDYSERLERALDRERAQHEAALEELKTAISELQARNEEYESTFEELQSTKELLDTAKVQLRAQQDALVEARRAMRDRAEVLARAEDDLKNLTQVARDAVIFLDADLTLRRLTPRAAELTGLAASDVGRSATELADVLGAELIEQARAVLCTATTRNTTVSTPGGSRSVARVGPYRTTENVIRGVVITLQGGGFEDD